MSDAGQFDYVIVGAGAGGCALANRLSRDSSVRVLLLEAGPEDTNVWMKIPAGVPRVVADPKVSWNYVSEPEPGLNNRQIAWPRGRTLGGSSSINGLVYMRGTPADYDGWREMGNEGWGWSDVLPYFKRGERHFGGESALHGANGELRVSPLTEPHPASDAFIEAAVNIGIPRNDDFNGPQQEGVGYLQFMIGDGERSSGASAFLNPVRDRPNLKVQTGALVERVLLEGRRATGVQYSLGGQSMRAQAGEVILCGGSVNSPQLLMLSGIGPGAQLAEHGVALVHDLPGVGNNLHDHMYAHCLARVDESFSINRQISSKLRMIPEVLRYLVSRRGLLNSAAAQVGLFTRTNPELIWPDLQLQMRPFSMVSNGGMYQTVPEPKITASCALLQPHSRGSITLRSADPREAPRMLANYLTDARDLPPLLAGIKMIRKIFMAEPLAQHVTGEELPGPGVQTDEQIIEYLRNNGQSMYHPVGSCSMGPDGDEMAVVDARLRVRGIQGLRIADASVMPKVPSGNTNAPTIMVAEKAADMIVEDARAGRR